MTQIQIKRVYERAEKNDGFRVLVDRLWPRGIKKEDLHYDLWAKGITPSTELREWFHQDIVGRWQQFKERYIKELDGSEAAAKLLYTLEGKKMVTLLYASKNTTENQALVLKDYLEQKLN